MQILDQQHIETQLSSRLQQLLTLQTFKTLSSTSDYLKAQYTSSAQDWTVVIAEQQSAGHGQYSRPFLSPAGGLYLSLAVPLASPNAASFQYTATTAVVLRQVLKDLFGMTVAVKWVNDLYWQQRKLAGILTDGIVNQQGQLIGLVMGIGLNYDGPVAQKAPFSSLANQIAERQVSLNRLIATLLTQLVPALEQPAPDLVAQYLQATQLIGRAVYRDAGWHDLLGHVTALTPTGQLHLTPHQIIQPGTKVYFKTGP